MDTLAPNLAPRRLDVAERAEVADLLQRCLARFPAVVAHAMETAHSELRSASSALRRLGEADFDQVVCHLYRMDDDDRQLRFCSSLKDESLLNYAQSINFNRDVVVGAFREGDLIGMCHLAVFTEAGHAVGEIGISVDRGQRGRRHGARLTDAALVEAALRRVTRVHIQFLRSNRRMAGMAARLGGRIVYDGGEGTATLELHPQDAEMQIESAFVGSRRLEVFKKGPLDGKTVALVHGAGGDAWQWRQNFMPYLANKGARCVSLSLRNHGRSSKDAARSLDDYVADLAEVLGDPTTRPILVGHSLGGLVVQRYLESHDAQKAVLLGAVPPTGLQGEDLEQALSALRSEFAREVLVQMMADFRPIEVARIDTPVTVVGGARDLVIPPKLVFETADAYGTLAHIIPDAGHALMLGRPWRLAASLV